MKKGQVTVFIIIGVLIVVGLLILFFIFSGPGLNVADVDNIQPFIESCSREATEEAISILSQKGGDISPKGYISYNGQEITYLCYSTATYLPCVNQRPLLVEHIENEITNYITPIISECFLELRGNLEDRYEIEESGLIVETTLQSKNVVVKIDKDYKITRGSEVRDFDGFRMNLVHPVYDFAKLSMEIVNQESKYCNFDELGYMIIHPEIDIEKFVSGDADLIYKLKEVATDQNFTFALKSCTLPAGY